MEHAYQAAKTLDLEKRRIFTLDFNPNLTASQAKKIGRKLELRDDWDIGEQERERMLKQSFYMKNYSMVLGERIKAFKENS